jgi:predicted enzyme related to lactoylglutathione lyase
VAGKLVHVEIRAKEIERAQEFWNGVFDWGIGPSAMPDMDYRMFSTGEGQGGGLYTDPDSTGELVVYFDTDDIDSTLARVREHGGEPGPKQPIPGNGWFAHCKDSEGNAFSLYQADEEAA